MVDQLRAAPVVSPQGSGTASHIASLDGLRGLAALMVLTTHVAFHTGAVKTGFLGPVVSRLDLGVCLFFLLSGFLLYRPWALSAMSGTPGPEVGGYARKRFARIYPAYVIVIVVVLGLYPPVAVAPADEWVAYLTLTQIYTPGVEVAQLSQMWSLATEAAFYLALPMLAWLAGRRHRGNPDRSARWQWMILAAMALVALGFHLVRAWTTVLPDWLSSFWLPGHLDWFAAGMALAVVSARLSLPRSHGQPEGYRILRIMSRDTATCLVVAALLYAIACSPVAGKYYFDQTFGPDLAGPWGGMVKHYLYGGVAFFLLLPLVLGARRSAYDRFLSTPAVQYLGTISYGVFLWHLLLISVIASALGLQVFGGGFLILWPLTVAASVAVATVSWHFLERPILRRARRRSARARPEPPVPSPAP